MIRFKQTALAAALVAGFAAAGTAQSAVTNVVAEGLHYPFVYYDTKANIDTWFSVHTTSVIGQDTVPNDYTAPHVWAAGKQAGYVGGLGFLYLNWFNYKSEKVYDQIIPVTPNDKEYFSLSELGVNAGGNMNGVPGYIVIVSDSGRQGLDGDILMMGDAVLTVGSGFPDLVTLPVLPLADGADKGRTVPSNDNNCVSIGSGAIVQQVQCSPIVAATRTDNADADRRDWVVVDLELVPLNDSFQTLIAWFDRNGVGPVGYDRFDDAENFCSGVINFPYEVTIIGLLSSGVPTPTIPGWWVNVPGGAAFVNLCQRSPGFNDYPGILRLKLTEGPLDASPGPNSAAFIWSIISSKPVNNTATDFGLTAIWAHDVGKVNQ